MCRICTVSKILAGTRCARVSNKFWGGQKKSVYTLVYQAL